MQISSFYHLLFQRKEVMYIKIFSILFHLQMKSLEFSINKMLLI